MYNIYYDYLYDMRILYIYPYLYIYYYSCLLFFLFANLLLNNLFIAYKLKIAYLSN